LYVLNPCGVPHDQVEAMTMGDRVAVLKDGLLQQCDTPRGLYDAPANAFVAGFIGSPAMNLLTVERHPCALLRLAQLVVEEEEGGQVGPEQSPS
jgi:ABC-type sugar transport system ATPase subunit